MTAIFGHEMDVSTDSVLIDIFRCASPILDHNRIGVERREVDPYRFVSSTIAEEIPNEGNETAVAELVVDVIFDHVKREIISPCECPDRQQQIRRDVPPRRFQKYQGDARQADDEEAGSLGEHPSGIGEVSTEEPRRRLIGRRAWLLTSGHDRVGQPWAISAESDPGMHTFP